HDAQREQREAGERSTGEQLHEAEGGPRLRRLVADLLDRLHVDAGRRDEGPEPVEDHDEQREQDLVAQVRDLEDVLQAGEHRRLLQGASSWEGTQRLVCWLPFAGGRRSPHGAGMTSTVPPAAVMAASAEREKPWAFTVSARSTLPRPSTLTSAPLWVRPAAWSSSGSMVSRPVASRVSRFTAWYSTRKGLVNPFSLGTRMWRGSCPPSKPAGMDPRAFWPLVPRPAVLPPLPPMPRPTRLRRRLAPSLGWRSWILYMELLASVADGLFDNRKSTRLNSSHVKISYAVFCLKKKNKQNQTQNSTD